MAGTGSLATHDHARQGDLVPTGQVLSASGSMAQINPLRYRGYYYDTDTGLYYLQSRYYDPQIGRFINADDPGLIASLSQSTVMGTNLFVYCDNNPVMYSDPTGHISPANIIGAIIGVVGGAIIGKLIVNHFNLKGWKKWVVLGGASLLLGVLGWFSGPTLLKLIRSLVTKMIESGKLFIGRISVNVLKALKSSKWIINQAEKYILKRIPKLKLTKTVAKNLKTRPYIKSYNTIKNIIQSATPKFDKSLKFGLKWVAKGSFNGKKGVYELVIDITKMTIVHFLFKGGK